MGTSWLKTVLTERYSTKPKRDSMAERGTKEFSWGEVQIGKGHILKLANQINDLKSCYRSDNRCFSALFGLVTAETLSDKNKNKYEL
jgi:hypothetical protein